MPEKVRVGIIGAGGYTVSRMLPGFLKVPDCEVTAVANRNRVNAEKVAAQFGIPKVLDRWEDVIASPDVDAVLIGTPPSFHPEITFAALEAGKHEIIFAAGDYFRAQGLDLPEPLFVDEVALRFGIANTEQHYHVPLLVSPWSYSTYRGS